MSGEVVSFTEAARRVATADADVVALRATAEDLAQDAPPELRFREGDDVQIIYRPLEGRPDIRCVMYGPNNREVVRELCRHLGREPLELIASPAGDPRPFDLTWISAAPKTRSAGERLARVRGVSHIQLNMALGRPIVRVEHNHMTGRITPLSGPSADEAVPPLETGDDE